MIQYDTYLEIATDGRCLAHVPELPGLVVRADSRARALDLLPGAAAEYHDWLGRHGEPVPSDSRQFQFPVAKEYRDYGPFETRSATALLPPDREPLTLDEMEVLLRYMDHSRQDLLALVRELPKTLFEWQPEPDEFNIGQILRHVGNAEKWYVSRLVPDEDLPPAWKDDSQLPIFDYLEMTRRTGVAQLRRLSLEQRSDVVRPQGWQSDPEEPWTARKLLRRFLEHEREHNWQITKVLHDFRQTQLAQLASERAGLWGQYLGLDDIALTELRVVDDWTLTQILGYHAAWDRWQDEVMRSMVAGAQPDLTALEDFAATSEAFAASWRRRPLAAAVAEFRAARTEWVSWLAALPVKEFCKFRSYGGVDWTFAANPLPVQWQHDAGRANQITFWRQAQEVKAVAGPKAILLAALKAARIELLAVASLIPPRERSSRAVCGDWSLKDLIGHIADWEQLGIEGLRQMATGQDTQTEPIADLDAWNKDHVQARQGQTWSQVWSDLQQARRSLLGIINAMSDAGLARSFPYPWGEEGTLYQWIAIYFDHDRSHARDLQPWWTGQDSYE